MKKNIDKTLISQEYKGFLIQYEKLGFNLTQALDLLIKENNIPFLSINYRIKDTDSFIGKIERKSYNNPFLEIEDICGIRIICYYQSDVERIKELIKKELIVLENENKVEKLDFDQFGYRSMHFIVKIPEQWLIAPNYRGLENLKAEIQVRTVLMHAWAEIEHKLAYKSESQIPKEYRRKLSLISAKLEESDEQFEEIKKQIDNNKELLISSANHTQQFDTNVEFNLDNLQAFLDYAFPDREKDIKYTIELFEEMHKYNLSLKELVEGYNKTNSILKEIEEKCGGIPDEKNKVFWAQVGAARTILELTVDTYFADRLDHPDVDIIRIYREK